MADVYLAIVNGPSGSGFTKLAVVKRLRPNLVEEPEFVAMLVDEARISARLNHPNVVQTHEVGIDISQLHTELTTLVFQFLSLPCEELVAELLRHCPLHSLFHTKLAQLRAHEL